MMIRSPLLHATLDLVRRFHLAREHRARHLGQLLVAAEAQSDQLRHAELVDPRPQILGQQLLQAQRLFEPDDAVLLPQRVEAREQRDGRDGDRHEDAPDPQERERRRRRPPEQQHDLQHHVQREDRNGEEVKDRMETTVRRVALFLIRHDCTSPQKMYWGRTRATSSAAVRPGPGCTRKWPGIFILTAPFATAAGTSTTMTLTGISPASSSKISRIFFT